MDAFDGLADPVRRRLLAALATGPLTAGELAAGEPISRPAVSRHLRVLLETGLVEATAEGRHRRYRLRTEALDAVEAFSATLRRPPIPASALDALELEVRRTVRDHTRRDAAVRHRPDEEETA